MQIKTTRIVLVVAVILLVTSEILRWALGIFGAVGGGVGLVITAAVYIFCARKAKAGIKYNVWILAPTIIFVIIPTASKVWDFFTDPEPLLLERLWEYGPFLISFVLPVTLLLLVYIELGNYVE